MSRLYAWIESDTRKTTLTTRGNEWIYIRVHYGSKYDSKKAVVVTVQFPKGEKEPIVEISANTLIRLT